MKDRTESTVSTKATSFFISPNTKYKLSNSGNANVDVMTVNFTNPLAVTQDYLPKSIVNALLNGSCDPDAPQTSSRYEDVFCLIVEGGKTARSAAK